MVEGLASLLGGTDKDTQVVQHIPLSRKAVKAFGSQSALYFTLLCCLPAACGI